MSLRDHLNPATVPDPGRTPRQHPKGFEPEVRFVSGRPSEVVVCTQEVPDDTQYRAQIHQLTGLDIPEERTVELTQVRYWGDPDKPYIYCRFVISDRPTAKADMEFDDVLRRLRTKKPRPVATVYDGGATFCNSWNDWQLGKLEGGGTLALADRLGNAFESTAQRAKELRKINRDLGHLLIIGGGDIIEGCNIFPNQAYQIDLDRRGQVRTAVAFVLSGLDRLAPLFNRVTVLVVGGNHGEHRQSDNRVNRHDNDDCAVFEHAAVAAERDERLSHVNFVIAQEELAKTVDVHGWIVGTTHGHVFGRNSSGSIEQKAYRWYSGQAAGHNSIGDAHLLVTHHWHHYAVRDWGACQWVQTPALDGGSAFFSDFSGQRALPGLLTWVTSQDQRYADAQILE